jgi:hypothetical protein
MLRLTIYTFYDLIEAWQIIIVICAFLSNVCWNLWCH